MLRNKLKVQKVKCKTKTQNFLAYYLEQARCRHLLTHWRGKFLVLSFSFTLCALRLTFSFAQEQFIYDAKGKRNPFIPLITSDGRLLKLDQEEEVGGLLLEGIMYDKSGRSYAIVNGSIVGIGDTVDDYQVLKIGDKKVTFIKDGEPKEVELKKEEP